MNLYQQLITEPEEYPYAAINKDEAEFLQHFVQKHKLKNTLEIGFAYGTSAAHIMKGTGRKHTVVDPYQSIFGWHGVKNIQKIGYFKHLIHIKLTSQEALPDLIKRKRCYDFIFIDGDHKFDSVFVDFYFSDLLLSRRGYIVLHDRWMPAIQSVAGFIKTNRTDYKLLSQPKKTRSFIIFQKVGKDNRSWDHFKDFTKATSKFYFEGYGYEKQTLTKNKK